MAAKFFIIVLLLLALVSPAYPQERLWDDLQEQAITFYQRKQHYNAVATQAKALKVAIETFGPDDLKVAESMDNLAIYNQALGNYAESEKLYEKALSIMEKKLPLNDHYLAIFMDYVASFYKKIGKNDKARELHERVNKIRGYNEKSLPGQ